MTARYIFTGSLLWPCDARRPAFPRWAACGRQVGQIASLLEATASPRRWDAASSSLVGRWAHQDRT
jgi:hypothetical protein